MDDISDDEWSSRRMTNADGSVSLVLVNNKTGDSFGASTAYEVRCRYTICPRFNIV
jgi:hypothetical protein